jgi:PPOX class probable F420-dependent enzyme
METDEARRRFADARLVRLATVGADGRPHLVPICFALALAGGGGGVDVVYSATDHKPKSGRPLRRFAGVQANGHVCLLADEYHEDWSALWWVRVDGYARVVADPAEVTRAVSALVHRYPQYRDRPPHEPVLAVSVLRWSGWSAGG